MVSPAMHGKSTDVDSRFCRHADCLRKFPRVHEKLTEVYRMSCTSTEFWQKVPRTHGRFTEGPADAQMLTEVFRKSCASIECWRKFPFMHRKLTQGSKFSRKADSRCCGHTESWRKVSRMQWMLTEDSTVSRKVDKSVQQVPRTHEKFTEGPADAQKLTEVFRKSCASIECWRKFPWMHGKLTQDDDLEHSHFSGDS